MFVLERFKRRDTSSAAKINNVNIPFIAEAAIRSMLWKEYGIGPAEYEQLNPDWALLMVAVKSAENRAHNEEISNATRK